MWIFLLLFVLFIIVLVLHIVIRFWYLLCRNLSGLLLTGLSKQALCEARNGTSNFTCCTFQIMKTVLGLFLGNVSGLLCLVLCRVWRHTFYNTTHRIWNVLHNWCRFQLVSRLCIRLNLIAKLVPIDVIKVMLTHFRKSFPNRWHNIIISNWHSQDLYSNLIFIMRYWDRFELF